MAIEKSLWRVAKRTVLVALAVAGPVAVVGFVVAGLGLVDGQITALAGFCVGAGLVNLFTQEVC
jgi:dienelactone hydrolase